MREALSRRSALLGIGSCTLSAAGAGLADTAAAGARHPDADLLKLVDDLAAAEGRRAASAEDSEIAFDRLDAPRIPDALEYRDGDFPYVCCSRDRLARYALDGKERDFYEGPTDLTLWAQRYWNEGEAYKNKQFAKAERDRVREIRTAFEAWQRDTVQAERACGLTAAYEAEIQATDEATELLRRIALTPSHTNQGLAAKARAARFAHVFYPERHKEVLAELLSAKYVDWKSVIAASLFADVTDLARLADSYEGRSAA